MAILPKLPDMLLTQTTMRFRFSQEVHTQIHSQIICLKLVQMKDPANLRFWTPVEGAPSIF